MSRHILTTLLLTVPTLSGFLYVPYAFPTISYHPPLTVAAETDQVLVLQATRHYAWNAIFLSIGPEETYELHRCQLLQQAQTNVESDFSLGLGYGLVGLLCHPMSLFIPIPSYVIHQTEPVVILYRPGYKPQHIRGWILNKNIVWERATTLEEEREAFKSCFGFGYNQVVSFKELPMEENAVYNHFIRQERTRLGLENTLGTQGQSGDKAQ